jgi:hypothetical protein
MANVLDIHYDIYFYLGSEGNKQQAFRVILDTGSTLTWVAAKECSECA